MMADFTWPPPVAITMVRCDGCGMDFGIVSFGYVPSRWRCPPCDYWNDRKN